MDFLLRKSEMLCMLHTPIRNSRIIRAPFCSFPLTPPPNAIPTILVTDILPKLTHDLWKQTQINFAIKLVYDLANTYHILHAYNHQKDNDPKPPVAVTDLRASYGRKCKGRRSIFRFYSLCRLPSTEFFELADF